MGFFDKFFKKENKETLDQGMQKTKQGLFEKIARAVAGRSTVDDDVLDDLEEVLVTSDVGVDTTLRIIERIQARVAKDKYVGTSELNEILRQEITALLVENQREELDGFTVKEDAKRPYVMLVVGVNGVGKTTTIGKLAYQFKKAGNKVVLGAADIEAEVLGDVQVEAMYPGRTGGVGLGILTLVAAQIVVLLYEAPESNAVGLALELDFVIVGRDVHQVHRHTVAIHIIAVEEAQVACRVGLVEQAHVRAQQEAA